MHKHLLFFIGILVLSGCAHSVHQYSVNSSDSRTGRLVTANSEQFVVLGFVSDTKYVDQAFDRLKSQCPNGRIDGINTRYSTSLGFFSWTNKILMRGYCLAKL